MTDADHERALRAGRNAMARLAAEKSGEPYRPEKLEKTVRPVKLPGLGVRIGGGSVHVNEWRGRRLGDLAGAHAELTDGTRPHRVGAALVTAPLSLGAGLLIGLTRKSKASAFVVFADGTVHERKLDGKSAISAAQRDAVKFNALANAAK
ncbi:MAG TPA: hypothetical protein VF060_16025 [Trebonia sp.]